MVDAELAERVCRLIRQVADEDLLAHFRKLEADDIQRKRSGDLVTIADIASERRLTEGLASLLPGAQVVGEEAVERDAGLLDLLDRREGTCWVVDPLDGTANFAAGKAGFCIIVSLVRDTQTVAGWIYDVTAGTMAEGIAGHGVTFNGMPLSPEEAPSRPSGLVGFNIRQAVEEWPHARRKQLGNLYSLGSAGLEFLELLAGRASFCLYQRTKPWDHAAGAFLLCEAGGASLQLKGGPYRPGQPSDAGFLGARPGSILPRVRMLLGDWL